MLDLRLTVVGFVIGVAAGTLGIGGGSLLAPILIMFFGVKPSIAIGTDLLYSVPMRAIAAYGHVRQGTIDRTAIVHLAIGGIPGSAIGLALFAFVLKKLPSHQQDQILRHAIGIVILVAAASALVMYLVAAYKSRKVRSPYRYRAASTIAIGVVVGCFVAMTSIGAGAITLPLMLLTLPMMPLRNLIGSEIVFAAIIIPVSAAGHTAFFADVDWVMALSLMLGAVPGAYAGARMCVRLSESVLRPAVIGILAFAGVNLL
ncbi:MAG: sulfite exporter TauE/SafE family protein [Candidatus Velthaea sp.]